MSGTQGSVTFKPGFRCRRLLRCSCQCMLLLCLLPCNGSSIPGCSVTFLCSRSCHLSGKLLCWKCSCYRLDLWSCCWLGWLRHWVWKLLQRGGGSSSGFSGLCLPGLGYELLRGRLRRQGRQRLGDLSHNASQGSRCSVVDNLCIYAAGTPPKL